MKDTINNERRAEKARVAIDAYWADQTLEDTDTKASDLICDVLHAVMAEAPAGSDSQLPFFVVGRALNHFLCETHPDSNGGEDADYDARTEDVEHAVLAISTYLYGVKVSQ